MRGHGAWRAMRGEGVSLAGFLMLVASIPAWVAYADWAERRAMRAAWAISGPACPVAQGPWRAPRVFDYGGVRFARRFGHVSCVAASEGAPWNRRTYRVCQFTGPDTVAVRLESSVHVFKPGVGRRATVTVRGDAPSCVVGGWFGG